MNDPDHYSERIQRVVDYLAEHLDETLDLEILARVAHSSPYHFHRVYRGLLGETVNGTVRRLRLHRSAIDLPVKRHLPAHFATNMASHRPAIA
jgi:AraC family transcriptional regulator